MATAHHGYSIIIDAVELEVLRSLLNAECMSLWKEYGDVMYSPGSRAACIVNLKNALDHARITG